MNRRIRLTLICSTLLALLLTGIASPVLYAQTPAQTPSPDPQADAHRARGQALTAKNDYTGAIAEYQKAYDLDKSGHYKDAALDLDKIGECYASLRSYSQAASYYQDALTIQRNINDQIGMMATLNGIGAMTGAPSPAPVEPPNTDTVNDNILADTHRANAKDFIAQNQYFPATQEYQKAYDLDKTAHPKELALDLEGLGTSNLKLTQAEMSAALLQQSFATTQQPNDSEGEDVPESTSNTSPSPSALFKFYAAAIQKQLSQASRYYQQALSIERKLGNKQAETAINDDMALLDKANARWQTALQQHQKAVAVQQQMNAVPSSAPPAAQSPAPSPKAAAHRANGRALISKNDYHGAIAEYQQAYDLDKVVHLKDAAADQDRIGECYYGLFKLALPLAIYHSDDAPALGNILGGYSGIFKPIMVAADAYKQALAIQQEIGDKAGEAVTQSDMDQLKTTVSRFMAARGHQHQPLPPPPPPITAAAHRANGDALAAKYDYSSAIGEYQQAYDLDKTTDPKNAAFDLDEIGICYFHMPYFVPATTSFQQAFVIQQRIGDTQGAAETQRDMAALTMDAYQEQQAAADKRQQAADKASEAQKPDPSKMSSQIGDVMARVYDQSGQYGKELQVYQSVLTVTGYNNDQPGQAQVLSRIGLVYGKLGQFDQAFSSCRQALAIELQFKDRKDEAETRIDIGSLHQSLSNYAEALLSYQSALDVAKKIDYKRGEVEALSGIGSVYCAQSKLSLALICYLQALSVEKTISDKRTAVAHLLNASPDQAATLITIAGICHDLGRYTEAVSYYQQALPLQQQADDKPGEATTLENIFTALKLLKKPGLAIFYGKQAINTYQSIRAKIGKVDNESQKVYLTAHQGAYRALADLLISQGRLFEAQQVLRMLKEREFYDFLNPDANAPAPTMDSVVLTKREAHWTAVYDADAQPLIDLGGEEQTLSVKKDRTPEEDKRLTILQRQIAYATTALNAVLKQIATAFSGPPTAADAPPQTTGAQDLQRSLPPGTVALYTIVSPDRLDLILITHDIQKAYRSAITADALYQKVSALRQALTDPMADPTQPAADLYRLVLGPVQKDLDAAGAKTILFSLDDALHYIPPAVLYNPATKQYVAERYQTELITLAGAKPSVAASGPLSVLGMGVSTAQDGDPALPGVATELQAIVHEPGDAGGMVPGRRLLDDKFTQAALEDNLKTAGYPLVHLASHFALHTTQDTSYLLLGDGSHYTVAALAKDPQRFKGVELLTLSACQTAMEVRGGSGGREVEGVGALAQSLGAGSVLASLWPVSDAATPVLMGALYGYRQAHPSASLAEALQAAQLSLLHKPMPASVDAAKRGIELVPSASDGKDAPPFVPDSNAPYAHPFYWAPFILIGNWQ